MHYTKAVEHNPNSANAHHNAASVCQRLRRFGDAVRHYESALRIKPTHLEAASNLAVALLNDKRPREAVSACRRALDVEAERGGFNSEAFHHLNVALRLCGERAAAVEETWRQLALLDATFRRPPPVPPHRDELAPGESGARASPLSVVCVKWGALYGADYVNKLYRGVRRQLSIDLAPRFICFTDDPTDLLPEIEARSLPTCEWTGWWYKAYLFSAGSGLRGRVLYLDLDTVLTGPLAPLATYRGAPPVVAAWL